MQTMRRAARILAEMLDQLNGGEGGIRTPDTLSGMPVFKTGAINHSATSPIYYGFTTVRNFDEAAAEVMSLFSISCGPFPFKYSGFQDRLFQPLTHPSAEQALLCAD